MKRAKKKKRFLLIKTSLEVSGKIKKNQFLSSTQPKARVRATGQTSK